MASLVWVCRRCSGGVACHDSGRRALRRAHRDRKTTKGNKTLKQNAADRNSGERCRLQPCPDLRSPGACARHATSQEHSGARLHHHHVAGGPLHPVSCAHSASCAHEAWDAAPPTPHGLDGHRDGPAPQETPGGLARAQAAPARANDVRWDCAALASAVRHGGHGGHRGPLPLGSGGAPRGWVHTLGQGRRSSTLEGHDDEGVGRQRGIEAPPRGTPKKKRLHHASRGCGVDKNGANQLHSMRASRIFAGPSRPDRALPDRRGRSKACFAAQTGADGIDCHADPSSVRPTPVPF